MEFPSTTSAEGGDVAKAVLNRITGALRNSAHMEQRTLSDSELINQFRKHRDEEAFATLVRRHGKAVLAACRQVLTDPADIDDAFQAVFLVLLQKIAVINGTQLGSWLYAVAHRVAVRAYSDSHRRTKREGAAASRRQVESPTSDPSWREAIAILHEELDRMPDAYRRVLLLCYLSGQSREEAASNLSWTPGAVKGRLERGRKMLADRLVRRGITLSVGLLAVVTGNSVGMDSPPTCLIERAVREATESSSPTVSALAHGAFPMANAVKKVLLCVTAVAGVAVLTGLGLAISPLASPEKDAQPPTKNKVSEGPPTATPLKATETKKLTRVIVKDSTGSPISGATVIASYMGSGEPFTFTTDKKGQFNFDASITGQSSGYTATILAVKDGYAPTHGYLPANTDEVVLTLPDAAEYQGVVKDRVGQPIQGAQIQFGVIAKNANFTSWSYAYANHLTGTPFEKFFFAKTDAAGTFRFTTVPEGAELIFRATGKGFAETDTAGGNPKKEYVVGPNAKSAVIVLVPEAIVSGRITSRVPGIEPAGLSVRLTGVPAFATQGQTVKADGQGRFAFRGLPAGEVSLTIDFPKGARAVTKGRLVATKEGETREVNMEVIEGVEVMGRVCVQGTGQPVAGAGIAAGDIISPKTAEVAIAQCDSAGRFVLRLPPGEASFYVQVSPGFSSPNGNGNGRDCRKVTIPEGVKTLTIPEPLEVIPVEDGLKGRVTDAAGTPIAHVKVLALQHSSPCNFPIDPVTASFDGQFTLHPSPFVTPLAPGHSVPLQVELSDGQRYEANALIVKGSVSEVRLPTLPGIAGLKDVKPTELAGIVVDEKGKPLAGVKVHIYDSNDDPENYTFTGADGMFRIKDCDRELKVQVSFKKTGYSPVMMTRQKIGVQGLVIAMDRSTYFEGVVRGPDGKPAAVAIIRADQGPKISDGCKFVEMITETKTDAQGRYRLYVQPDEYSFKIRAPGVSQRVTCRRPG